MMQTTDTFDDIEVLVSGTIRTEEKKKAFMNTKQRVNIRITKS